MLPESCQEEALLNLIACSTLDITMLSISSKIASCSFLLNVAITFFFLHCFPSQAFLLNVWLAPRVPKTGMDYFAPSEATFSSNVLSDSMFTTANQPGDSSVWIESILFYCRSLGVETKEASKVEHFILQNRISVSFER